MLLASLIIKKSGANTSENLKDLEELFLWYGMHVDVVEGSSTILECATRHEGVI